MLVINTVNGSNVVYDTEFTHSVREYYLYCVGLFMSVLLERQEPPVNLIFGDFDYEFHNSLDTIRVFFQYEHTLVKPGGRDSGGYSTGNCKINDKDYYLVRLVNSDRIERSGLVIEYSIPNRFNVGSSGLYRYYNNACLSIAACLYAIDFSQNRPKRVITNFYDPRQPRRHELLKQIGSVNFTGVYGEDLAKLYSSTKVLVNIHQTDHHDTLEELRVLPALRRGAIVIAEHSALEKLVPYYEHIIWADYNDIPHVLGNVLDNYDDYHKEIFNDSLRGIFKRLENRNLAEVERGLS